MRRSLLSFFAAVISIAPIASAATPSDSDWHYIHDVDEVTGVVRDYACALSLEGATFCLRKTGKRLESYLSFKNGGEQFLCTSHHCASMVKVDENPAFAVPGGEFADGNSSALFLLSAARLQASLRGARHFDVEPPMFEHDGLVLHFAARGLKW